MVRHFRLYLTVVLIVFTLIFSAAIGLYDYYKGQRQIVSNHEREIDLIENSVVQSLYVIDQMYDLTNESLGDKMKEKMDILIAKYEENPNFQQWDFQRFKKQFDMDVYIIDDTNTVIHSSFEPDIGLNFEECCGSFSKIIEDRRLGGQFKHDGMDVQQFTGEIKKFAFMPTPDKKYLIELSMSLEDGEVFRSFNILEKIKQLEETYEPIHSIRVYNPTGISFGSLGEQGGAAEISAEMRPYFEEAKQENEVREKTVSSNGTNITYRYIPYEAVYEQDYPMKRIVEIVYNEVELKGLLKFYRDVFIYQQIIILLSVILLAIIMGRIISKPVYLAFHDSLTNLKNRAAFEVEGNRKLKRNNKKVSLMMIDVDNFKQVNDQLGHIEGDRLLRNIAKIIEDNILSDSIPARVGGDEFVVICINRSKVELQKQAEELLRELNNVYESINEEYSLGVSISIGIADAEDGEKLSTVYDKADQALYQAKNNGKNQFAFYENGSLSNNVGEEF